MGTETRTKLRSIVRGAPPADVDLGSYQRANSDWPALASGQTDQSKRDYVALRRRLHQEFSGLCAYCERKVRKKKGEPGPIDHFRPRNPATGTQLSHFGAVLTFDWSNLVYACSDCQNRKNNKWPGILSTINESITDGALATMANSAGWTYTPVSVAEGYVNPNQNLDTLAHDHFEYNHQDGSIAPSRAMSQTQRSKGLRTISDIGLDDPNLSHARYDHIQSLKKHIESKGSERAVQEIDRLVEAHRRKRPKDMKDSAFGPGARFTGLVLFAFNNGWFP